MSYIIDLHYSDHTLANSLLNEASQHLHTWQSLQNVTISCIIKLKSFRVLKRQAEFCCYDLELQFSASHHWCHSQTAFIQSADSTPFSLFQFQYYVLKSLSTAHSSVIKDCRQSQIIRSGLNCKDIWWMSLRKKQELHKKLQMFIALKHSALSNNLNLTHLLLICFSLYWKVFLQSKDTTEKR